MMSAGGFGTLLAAMVIVMLVLPCLPYST